MCTRPEAFGDTSAGNVSQIGEQMRVIREIVADDVVFCEDVAFHGTIAGHVVVDLTARVPHLTDHHAQRHD